MKTVVEKLDVVEVDDGDGSAEHKKLGSFKCLSTASQMNILLSRAS